MNEIKIQELVEIKCEKEKVILEKNESIRILEKINLQEELKELLEKGIMYGGYESPEPGDLDAKGREILSHTYANCRSDGGDKEKCSKIAWSSVNKSDK